MKIKKVVHKPTNVWFWLAAKECFGLRTYSANDGKTWHASKQLAYESAVEDGSLARAQSDCVVPA